MRKFLTKKGHIAYECTREEMLKVSHGLGICDWCATSHFNLFLVPVLNSAMCPECFKTWENRATFYEEDKDFEVEYAHTIDKLAHNNQIDLVDETGGCCGTNRRI